MENLPSLLVNESIIEQNLLRAIKKLSGASIDLRPHVKTIHDPKIALLLKNHGVQKICVSNMSMLRQFIHAGWTDICLAIPCPIHAIDELQQLLESFPDVRLLLYIDHEDQLAALQDVKFPFQICLEIDTGQHRSGIDWKQESRLLLMIQMIRNSSHSFVGLAAHFGYLYDCNTPQEIVDESANAMMKVLQLKEHLEHQLSESVEIAIGDTPSFLGMAYFDQVSEIRAGNYLMNDLTMVHKGLCDIQHVACALEAVVISKSVHDCRFVLHCGAIHLSKEKHSDLTIQYGLVAQRNQAWIDAPLSDSYVVELYQEHAVVVTSPDYIRRIQLGDRLCVLPVHSCLTMDAMYHKQRIVYISK